MFSGCSSLQGALLPTAIEIGGRVVMPLPKSGSSQALESALIPWRGQRARFRVEDGAAYESLVLLLHLAHVVGVSDIELEHGEGCRHVVPTDQGAETVGLRSSRWRCRRRATSSR
jgi:hypothetical protein